MKSYRKELWFDVPDAAGVRQHYPASGSLPARERRPRRAGAGERDAHHRVGLHQRRRIAACIRTTTAGWSKLAPHEPVSKYLHNRTGEDNADAHMKRQIMGREVVVAISGGKLDFGPWEQIFYGEFDGRRRKRALVKIIGE